MISQSYFLDSNIWLYCLLSNQSLDAQEGERKRNIARSLTEVEGVVISTQVINEVCSNTLRKASMTELQIKRLIRSFQVNCTIVTVEIDLLESASDLRSRYGFSFWDGLIVASALAADVAVLYSEDMQDGLVVAEQLEIINPFK
jgi:predicted nucleic acid-binding protein